MRATPVSLRVTASTGTTRFLLRLVLPIRRRLDRLDAVAPFVHECVVVVTQQRDDMRIAAEAARGLATDGDAGREPDVVTGVVVAGVMRGVGSVTVFTGISNLRFT